MTAWQPGASLPALQARAALLARLRAFFAERGVLEVETPFLARHGVTDLHIQCIAVPGYGYLQSSPEYHMKRLLAAGSGPIYQIARVFRDGECGRRHNPEFTLLEWYRPGFDLDALIRECLELLQPLLPAGPVRRVAFRELFREVTGLDPLTAPLSALAAWAAERHGPLPDLDRAALVDLLMATDVEAALPPGQLTVVERFPGWAAALAQTTRDADGTPVALRFEIYAGGYELANGYQELLDAGEQARRFQQDQRARQQQGRPSMVADPWLLQALEAGLPDCSGVAIGVDRLLMCLLGEDDIRRLLSFPHDRA